MKMCLWSEQKRVCFSQEMNIKRFSLSSVILSLWINVYTDHTHLSHVESPFTSSQWNEIPFSFGSLADCHPFLQPAHKRHLLPQRGMCQQAAEWPHQLWGKLKIPSNRLHQLLCFVFCFFSVTQLTVRKHYFTWRQIWCYLGPLP